MLYSYLKMALRSIQRNKGFSILNIGGLTLGLLSCLLIALFVRDEFSYDSFIPQKESIYRAYYTIDNKDGVTLSATTPPTFPTALKENFPEVENTLRLLNFRSSVLFGTNEKKIYETGGVLSDSSFFNFFPLRFVYGNPTTSLQDKFDVVISNAFSEKYFGSADPVGKNVTIGKRVFHVSGVFVKPKQFHLDLNFVLPLASQELPPDRMNDWGWYGFYNYIKLKPGADISKLQAKFQKFTNPILNKTPGSTFTPFFQPLDKVHLYSADFEYDMAVHGNIRYVKAMVIIGLFILAIACFNFVNLATAQSLRRAKEVGVRKTIGAGRGQLLGQFLGEAIALVVVAMMIALTLAYFLVPAFNRFTEKQIVFDLLNNSLASLCIIGATLFIGLLTGLYPALFLSRFTPSKVLKGAVTEQVTSRTGFSVRRTLVVFQFGISILLAIGAIVVIRQVNFMGKKDLGFNKDQILLIPMRGDQMDAHYEAFKNELSNSPLVKSVTVGYGFPGDTWGDGLLNFPNRSKDIKANLFMVDADYIPTFGMQITNGRNFSPRIQSDETAFILNETAVRELGYASSKDIIGEIVEWPTWRKQDSIKRGKVIGVVKDFHYKSIHDKIEPAALQIYTPAYSKIAVKVKGANMDEVLASVRQLWNRYSPDYPMEYAFLDEQFAKLYKSEQKIKVLLSLFTIVTISIACLGLLGLSAYAAERRRKELGVRKVLGASTAGLVMTLSREFMVLVLISFVVACPIAWYIMNGWLAKFAYRVDLSWPIFLTAGLFSLAIAFVAVGYQALRAAVSNPIQNLRSE